MSDKIKINAKNTTREEINIDVSDGIKINDQSINQSNDQKTIELFIIKEQDVVRKKNNSHEKDNIVKFKTTGRVRTINLLNEGITQVNKLFDKRIKRNENEDTPNVSDNEIVSTHNNKSNNELHANTDNIIDHGTNPKDEFREQEATGRTHIKARNNKDYVNTATVMAPNEVKIMERIISASSFVERNFTE